MNWFKQASLSCKVLSVRDEDGYEVRTEKCSIGLRDNSEVDMESSYAKKSGCYVGEEKEMKHLIDKMGIDPDTLEAPKDCHVCTIGLNPKSKTWFGWSHRAINGFGVGDKPLAATPFGNETNHQGPAKDLDQAKEYALEFAESVS
jgi:hypothetical protein